jgi:hypothetical protein
MLYLITHTGDVKKIGQNPDFASTHQPTLDLMDMFLNTFEAKKLEIFYDENES